MVCVHKDREMEIMCKAFAGTLKPALVNICAHPDPSAII